MIESTMQDALTSLVTGAFKDLPSQQVFWGLVGAKGLDVALGILKALLNKQIDPSELKKAPLHFLAVTLAAGLLMCLHMVNSQFDPLIGIAVVSMGASEGASILRNFSAICVALGQPVPAWVNTMTSYLAAISNKGVNDMLSAPQQAGGSQPVVDVPGGAVEPVRSEPGPSMGG